MPDRRAGADTTLALETLRARAADLPPWLRAHTGRVVAEGRRLAQLHEVDPSRVQAAAWGHDLYRHLDDEALLRAAGELAITPGAAEQAAPILLHGPVAAARAERAWGVGDAEVLEAIRFHTTGHPDMRPRRADALPGRQAGARRRWRPTRDWRASASWPSTIPPGALLAFLDRRITHYVSNGRVLHPVALATRNWALGRAQSEGAGR